jgi:tellurite resistance protein TerC
LRSLYFLVAGFMGQFRFLKYGLSAVLAFIGAKMLLERWVQVPIHVSLLIIFFLLSVAIVASLLRPEKNASAVKP